MTRALLDILINHSNGSGSTTIVSAAQEIEKPISSRQSRDLNCNLLHFQRLELVFSK